MTIEEQIVALDKQIETATRKVNETPELAEVRGIRLANLQARRAELIAQLAA